MLIGDVLFSDSERENRFPRAYAPATTSHAELRSAGYNISSLRGEKLTSHDLTVGVLRYEINKKGEQVSPLSLLSHCEI